MSSQTQSNVLSLLLAPQACPRAPGCHGEGTFGCQLEPLGSSCQALRENGSHRHENGAFFSWLLLGCGQAGPASSSIPALSGQGGSEWG